MNKRLAKFLADKLHIITVLAYVLVILFCVFTSYHLQARPVPTGAVDDTDNWYYKYQTDDNNWLKINIPTYLEEHKPAKGQLYLLTCTLPDTLYPNHAIRFKTKNCWTTVSVNDTVIYTDIPEDGTDSVDYTGIMNHIVSIPPSAAGQTLEISFTPCTSHDVFLIDTIYCGDADELLIGAVKDNIVSLIVSVSIIFMGLVLLFTGMTDRHSRTGQKYLHLGLFSILFGFFSVNQLDLLQMFFGDSVFLYNADVLTLALMPYPALSFIMISCDILPTIRHRIAQAVPLLEFVLVAIVYVTGLISPYESKLFVLLFILLTIIISGFYCFRYMIKHKAWQQPSKYALHFTYILFLICLILELSVYYSNHQVAYPLVSNYILYFAILFTILEFFRETRKYAEIGRNSEMLQDAAYYDSLTQLGNRTALNRDMEDLEQTLTANSSIAIIQLDINYLKRTNDVLGHIAGDRLLQNAAQAIRAGFSDYGKCYRFGGDEFVIILIDNPSEKYNLGISAMENECERINRGLQKLEHVSIAYGIAYYSPETDTSLWRVQERADVAMYERKRKMKEKKAGEKYQDDRL